MFVRTKTDSKGVQRHYLVASRREGGKVRQKVLFYLGDFATVEDALGGLEHSVRFHQDRAAASGASAKTWRGAIFPHTLAKHQRRPQYFSGPNSRRKYDPVPRPNLRLMAPAEYDVTHAYWQAREEAEWHEHQAVEYARRLASLRKVVAECSAQGLG